MYCTVRSFQSKFANSNGVLLFLIEVFLFLTEFSLLSYGILYTVESRISQRRMSDDPGPNHGAAALVVAGMVDDGGGGGDSFAWEPLEDAAATAQRDAKNAAGRGRSGAGAGEGKAVAGSWRTGSWREVAEVVKELKHDVGNVRAEIKGELEDAAKDMREIKAQLSQLVYRETERARATKQAEQREREAISATAATLLLEQDGPPVSESGSGRKSESKSGSRAATPDEVDGWTENELPLVKGPLSPASRLRTEGTESPPRPRSRGKSPPRSPPRSPTRKGAAPWVNKEVDDAPGSPDPDGPDGIDGGRFPRLPMGPAAPRLARPPSADVSESGPKAEPTTQSTEDPYGILGRLHAAETATPIAAAATADADGDAQVSTRASDRSMSPSQRSKSPPATLTQVTVGAQVPEHWGFPDQFFDSLPRAEAGGATSNMMPVTTGGYEFRPNLGADHDRDSFGGGGAQAHLERDIAIITKHQVKEHERRARSRLQSQEQRRERRHREESSSRHEHMGDKRPGNVLRLPRTPPHTGATFVGGEPLAARPSSVSSMSHTPDTATLSNLAIVPRPSSRGTRNTKLLFYAVLTSNLEG